MSRLNNALSISTLCYGTWKSWYHVVVSDGLVERCTLCSDVMRNVEIGTLRYAQRGNWNTTLCITWKKESLSRCAENTWIRFAISFRQNYLLIACKKLILIFTSDELPLLIYSVMPVKTNNCHMLLYIGQVFVMSEYSSLSLTTYINITSDIPQWHVLDIFINCFTDRFVTIRVHNKRSGYFCRMSLGNVCAGVRTKLETRRNLRHFTY